MLTFDYNGKSYRISFSHRIFEKIATDCSLWVKVCDIAGEKDWAHVDTAVAYCSTKDQFVKEIGRKLSLTRLLERGKCPAFAAKTFRVALWQAYLERKNKVEYQND